MLENLLGKLREMLHATIWALAGLMFSSIFGASVRTAVWLTVITAIFGCMGT